MTQEGYSKGAVDGRWNPQTATAARRFQQAAGLEPTSTPTTLLLATVGMSR
ncbi:peptidoglycan-binding domain-containing protein [Methylobacterium sp. J-070]|uniref:peptidoglycan-binding domain-containing protein n=1 Tax=Methylobacterium sp. J-070 TaxID=2836650 RepID=UPI001FBB928D|nr:peptidoglycan-binding domain-containing protein [Methylobacterium sp. J-070]MCJ2049499.1 peptidoglycan-binding protein [Methylobacterium sp. J-070]